MISSITAAILFATLQLQAGHTRPLNRPAGLAQMIPEERARQQIDLFLQESDWIVQGRSLPILPLNREPQSAKP